jgi:hypothetical protein
MPLKVSYYFNLFSTQKSAFFEVLRLGNGPEFGVKICPKSKSKTGISGRKNGAPGSCRRGSFAPRNVQG